MKAWRDRGGFCFKVHGNEYTMAGVPDIAGTFLGWSVWCETKMPGNKPSKIQLRRHHQIRKAGGLVVVGYSVTDVMEMLDHLENGEHFAADCTCTYSLPGGLG